MSPFPSLFIAHGAPDLPLSDHPAKHFLEGLPNHVRPPRAILIISAHWATNGLSLTAAPEPGAYHDFGGWPGALYDLKYPAPTSPEVIEEVQNLLGQAGFETGLNHRRGFDHGVWIPLLLCWPNADIPVVQLSLDRSGDPLRHFEIGLALAELRKKDVLVIGSGATVHNLDMLAPEGTPAPDWAREFDDWLYQKLSERDIDALLQVPVVPVFAKNAHPTIEHLLPLYVAMGAGWSGRYFERLHQSYSYGSISMSAFAFGEKGLCT